MGSWKIDYPQTLDALVVALCLDYRRREDAITDRLASRRTDMEFRYLNFHMRDAVAEISGERYAETFIEEIGKRVGYADSGVGYMTERMYKQQKREIKLNIARRLHLMD